MTSGTLTIPGFTIAYTAWGNPNNPPILALHGWLDNANSFAPLAPYLQEKYYVIAIDFPGHGHSSHLPAGCYYHFMDGIFSLIQIIRVLKLKQVHLLGHSMGACLASLAAGVAPEHFLSLALIEGLGPFSHPANMACKQLRDYLNYLLKEDNKQSKGYSSVDKAAKARALKGYVSYDIAKLLSERGLKEDQGAYFWRHDRRLLVPSPLRMTEEQILSCLEAIVAKTCLILGSQGFSFESELIAQRIKAAKQIEITRIEGGHHIHMEKPEEVANVLMSYFESF